MNIYRYILRYGVISVFFLMLLGIFFITKHFSVREKVAVDIMYHDNRFTAYVAKTACLYLKKGDTISIDFATHNQCSFLVLNETEESTHWRLSLEPIGDKQTLLNIFNNDTKQLGHTYTRDYKLIDVIMRYHYK